MMRGVAIALLAAALSAAAAPQGCIGGVGLASFRLAVQPSSGGASAALPIRQLNNLPVGYRITYRPLDLPADLRRDARLTLVLVPKAADGQVTVLEPRAAGSSGEWLVPFVPRVMLLVFAPQGLDEKRLSNLVTKEEALVMALADYADETAELEEGLQAARELEQFSDDEDGRPRATTPAEQAIIALVHALNPSVSAYDPLGAGRRPPPATMMGKGVGAFFDNAGGVIPGGGILPAVKTWLMPDTDFRSVYAIPADPEGLALCAQFQQRSRNKMAYVWAYRLTGVAAPAVSTVKDTDIPIGMRASVPVKLDRNTDWRVLDRAFEWTLISENGATPPLPVAVRPVPDERALQLDLRKFPGGPGAYRLEAKWDWSTMPVKGALRLHRMDDMKTARVTPESLDKLIAGSGPVTVDLSGADFLFVDRAWLHRPGSARQLPVELPAERGSGPLRADIDTDGLRAGTYSLALSRVDGAVTEIPLRLLPPPPRVDASGLRVNMGQREQRVTLSGAGLDRIENLESDRADFVLQPAADGGAHRDVVVRLRAEAKPGDQPALMAKVEGMGALLRFPGVLQVVGARPRIKEAKASLASDLGVAPREGEIPAGSWVSYSLSIEPPGAANASLTLQCAEPARTVQPLKLHLGEKLAAAQLVPAGDSAWFLSLDPGAAGQSGCTLTATMESEELGKSDAFTLGKVVRLPRIENFAMTDEKSASGFYGVLRGFDLETIEKTGWDARSGLAVADLPRPVAGEGARQSLRVAMPWPSPTPKAPLFVWLRGESEGRATKVQP